MHPEPEGEHEPLLQPPRGWSRRAQDLAVVLWTSFLIGGIATMCFFAVYDPVTLTEGTVVWRIASTHNAGYALGFFCFWAVGASAGTLAVYLIRTQQDEKRHAPGSSSRGES